MAMAQGQYDLQIRSCKEQCKEREREEDIRRWKDNINIIEWTGKAECEREGHIAKINCVYSRYKKKSLSELKIINCFTTLSKKSKLPLFS